MGCNLIEVSKLFILSHQFLGEYFQTFLGFQNFAFGRFLSADIADSGRYQPGTGHLDFKPGFRALKRIGYDGYMTMECKIKGEPSVEALKETAEYINAEWDAA